MSLLKLLPGVYSICFKMNYFTNVISLSVCCPLSPKTAHPSKFLPPQIQHSTFSIFPYLLVLHKCQLLCSCCHGVGGSFWPMPLTCLCLISHLSTANQCTMLVSCQFVTMYLRLQLHYVWKWSMAAGTGCNDQTADGEFLLNHEILRLTECYVGHEPPFSFDPGLCSKALAEAAANPEISPWGRAKDMGAAGLSRCLMPSIGLRAGMSEPGLIRNTGTTPGLTSESLSQKWFVLAYLFKG